MFMRKEFIEIFTDKCPFIAVGLKKFEENYGYDLKDKPLKFKFLPVLELVDSNFFT
jgi:hypothetical protein